MIKHRKQCMLDTEFCHLRKLMQKTKREKTTTSPPYTIVSQLGADVTTENKKYRNNIENVLLWQNTAGPLTVNLY